METAREYFKSPWRVFVYIILVIAAFLWFVPILTGLLTSVRTFDDILSNGFIAWPETFTFENFATAWERGGLSHNLPNRFIITLPSIALTMLLSSLGAYALARFNFKGNRLVFFTFVGGMLLPFQVLMLPVFRLTDFLGLYDTYWGLILFHTAFQLGFCTFMLRNYMRTENR